MPWSALFATLLLSAAFGAGTATDADDIDNHDTVQVRDTLLQVLINQTGTTRSLSSLDDADQDVDDAEEEDTAEEDSADEEDAEVSDDETYLRSEMVNLQTAVERGDVALFDEITANLRRKTVATASKTNMIGMTQRQNPDTINMKDGCIFDNYLFGMTDDGRKDLAAELSDPTMNEALEWVKTGGWWFCSGYGESCTCSGRVRMVDWDRKVETRVQFDARKAPKNEVVCDVNLFEGEDIIPGGLKVCECAHSAPGQSAADFHLHKRLTSTSYLQEAWIFLLRLLARIQKLPLGTGDRTYSGMQNWAARHIDGRMPMVLERLWLEMFVKQVVLPSTSSLHRCMEWGNPITPGQGFNYLNMLPQCTDKVDMQFDPVFNGQKPMSMEGNIVYSDIDNLPAVLAKQATTLGVDQRMGIIFATQVFEHIHNPQHAAKMLFASLHEGGCLVFTAPQQAQYHMVPHDFFRYTKEGAIQVLQEAGFCVPGWSVTGGGDFIMDIARNAGMQVQDFPYEEMQAAFQIGFDKVSDAAITIHALAFKPPHTACDAALPPIFNR